MSDEELYAEIAKSGTWLYDNEVEFELWIVRQNFDLNYEEGYDDGPEELNADGERYQIINALNGRIRSFGPSFLTLEEASANAATLVPQGIAWTNTRQQKFYGGRNYRLTDNPDSAQDFAGSVVIKTDLI